MKTLVIIASIFLFYQQETAAYKAAVLEHYPSTGNTTEETRSKNLDDYRKHVQAAKIQGGDIAVFPEYGLTTIVTDPEEYAVEITDSESLITELKHMATENNMYLVVNLLEKVVEANKPTKYYSTNVVFDREGSIILKYRKINLFNEPKLTAGDTNQTNTFTTNFGVTFGTFIGSDIFFNHPSRTVLNNSDVTSIAYTTAWTSTMPFLTSLTVQYGYALANRVNLLASNYGKPKESHGGSGIYLSDGKIAETYIADSASTKPIIQEVNSNKREDKSECIQRVPFALPGDETKSNVSNFITQRVFEASKYAFQNVDLSKPNQITVSQGSLNCKFEITVDTPGQDTYKIMAFDGLQEIGGKKFHLRVCSLVACDSNSIESCGNRVNVTTRFKKVKVESDVISENGAFYVPVGLNTFLLPLQRITYCSDDKEADTTHLQFETLEPQGELLVFGVVGRTSAAVTIHTLGLLMLPAIIVGKLFSV